MLELEKDFTDTIEGYEEYFENGNLTASDNSIILEEGTPSLGFWITSTDPRLSSPKIKNQFKSLGIFSLSAILELTPTGLPNKWDVQPTLKNFEPVKDLDNSINTLCAKGAFFSQALGVGSVGIIPFRYIIPNPDTSSSSPFLLVNVWRIGIRLDSKITNMADLQSTIPLDILSLNFSGVFSVIKEFVTITKSDNTLNYSRDFKSSIKTASLISKNKLKKFVHDLETGKTLIMSTYFTSDLSAFINASPSGVPLAMGVGVGGEARINLTNRLVLNKQSENELFANWSRLSQKELAAVLRINAVLGLNLAKLSVNQNNSYERTFKFKTDDAEDMDFIMNNLHTILPIGVPEKNRLKSRDFESSNLKACAGLIFWNALLDREKGKINLKDFVTGEEKTEEFRTLKVQKSKLIGYNTVIYQTFYRPSINDQSDLFISAYSKFASENLTRDKLKDVLEKSSGFLPEGFLPYDLTSVAYYFGEMMLETRTIVSHQGLAEFFSLENNVVGEKYVQFNDFPSESCKQKRRPIKIKVFLKDFTQAKKESQKLVSGNLKGSRRQILLKQVLDILYRFSEKRSFLHLIKDTIPKENYFTNATLLAIKDSQQDPLTGGTAYLGIDPQFAGELTPSPRHLVLDSNQQLEIFSNLVIYSTIKTVAENPQQALHR